MELDDLRRQWQQPENTPPLVSPAELGGMLMHNAGGLVEKMRRNTWFEILASILLALAAPVLLLRVGPGILIFRVYTVVFEVMAITLLYHYYRQLGLLKRMMQADVNVRAHLGVLCAGLRKLLHFYYRITLATLPLTLLLNLSYFVSQELAHPGPFRWALVCITGGVVLLVTGLAQLGVAAITRWYLQRLYGQHLDRLEASLHELDEPAPTIVR